MERKLEMRARKSKGLERDMPLVKSIIRFRFSWRLEMEISVLLR